MGKKSLSTPRSRVRAALRQVWLRSRERAAALKREGNCCESCGVKQSKRVGHEVKIACHHRHGINWDYILEEIYKHILCDPAELEVLCEECHNNLHEMEKW